MNPQNHNPYKPPQPQQPHQPAFGQPTNQNPYQMPGSANHKKQVFLMIGGAALIIILLLWLVFGGKSTPGQTDMQTAMQNTSDALWMVDEYQNDLQIGKTKSDIALTLILLRGNYQNLNELYNKTYKPKKKFSASPKADEKSKQELEGAKRTNVLDSQIITTLKPKIINANQALDKSKANFSKKESIETIEKAQTDLQAISDILEQPR